MDVTIRDVEDRTVTLGVEGDRWADPSGGRVDDLSTLWALSGLADAHAHLSQDELVVEPGDPEAIRRRAFVCLEDGVFLCLDKGWMGRVVLSLLEHPRAVRPDLQAAGRMIAAPGGYFVGFAVEVGPEELATVVEEEAKASAGWVKLVGDWPRKGRGPVPNFGVDALREAVEIAHAAGARVAIHTMAQEVPSTAVVAGVDSVEHGLFLTEDDVRALAARDGVWVPTVLQVERTRQMLGLDSSGGRLLGEGLDRVRALLPLAERLGLRVLAGTDLAVRSGLVGAEAARLVSYGLSRAAGLASASTSVYEDAGIEAGFRVGCPADLVAFRDNPLERVEVLTEPVVVLRRGRVLVDRRPQDLSR